MKPRSYNTTRDNNKFDDETILQVWRRGREVTGFPAPKDTIRLDACGAQMHWSDYGNTSSKYGWEVDHIKPVSDDGTDNLYNLQPLQWENNRAKSDGPLVCTVR